MTTRVPVDMNLSPEWIPVLRGYGWDAVHWSAVGDTGARDAEIMARARAERFVVFTLGLLGNAGSHARRRSQRTAVAGAGYTPRKRVSASCGMAALRRYETELIAGALVVVEEDRSRVRILPL